MIITLLSGEGSQILSTSLQISKAKSISVPVKLSGEYSNLKLEPYLLDYDREMMRKTFVSIYNATSENSVVKCDECGSKYIAAKSQMMYLCPECSHVLYGYENCNHKFKDGRCELCLWDGSVSEYIKGLKNSDEQ